jgi:hypothetical protein
MKGGFFSAEPGSVFATRPESDCRNEQVNFSMTSHTVHVHTAYTATNSDQATMRAGQEVRAGKRSEEWPGWVWCTASDGWSAWVPECDLEMRGETARFTRDYMAREFTVHVGEELTVVEETGGWLFCIDSRGERGWIPAHCAQSVVGRQSEENTK